MGLNPALLQPQQQPGGIDQLAQNAMFPQSQMDKTQYATPSQMPTSAEVVDSDYDAQTNAYTGMPTKPFASGGVTALKFDGEDGSQVQAPAPWDPSSGKVTLQKYNTQDPSADPTQVAYTIPKDSIKTFVPNTNDNGEPDPTAGGKYILNDGSTMIVGGDGTVTAATPARNEYTLNKDGYYQPTGSNLTWNGQANLLTKNIGGVDVQVPGMYTKGAYQTANGSMGLNTDGTVAPLAPNYLDSGSGQSGLDSLVPIGTTLLMGAMTGGAGLAALPEAAAGDAALAGVGGAAGEAGATGLTGAAANSGTFGQMMGGFNAVKNAANFAQNPNDVSSGVNAGMGVAKLAPTMFAAHGGLMASGGISNLGSYSDGGRLLKGPGDGMSDNIPAKIGHKQPARLADGEFVIPADVVSHLGNGSTDAGARVLYKMMERLRKARTGNPKQGKQINPNKYIPKG